MRSMESDRNHFLSYYPVQKDEDAFQFKQNRTDHMQQSLVKNLDEDESEQLVGTPVPPNRRTC